MNLSEINSRLKRTNIKGKDYIEVNQRVLAFRELFPLGRIITEKLSDDGKRCDFKATVYLYDQNGGGWVDVATGYAFEFQGAGVVNKTSYVENAETSAVGRALGFLGIGITESIASADEVQSAIEHQESGEEPTADLINAKRRLWNAILRWSELRRKEPKQVLKDVQSGKYGEYAETADALNEIAADFEGGCHVE